MKRCKSKIVFDENEECECVSVIVPEQYWQEVLSLAHESLFAGHLARTKTY